MLSGRPAPLASDGVPGKLRWDRARKPPALRPKDTAPTLGSDREVRAVLEPWDQEIQPRPRPRGAVSASEAIDAVRERQRVQARAAREREKQAIIETRPCPACGAAAGEPCSMTSAVHRVRRGAS
jgi:hypothetical protein